MTFNIGSSGVAVKKHAQYDSNIISQTYIFSQPKVISLWLGQWIFLLGTIINPEKVLGKPAWVTMAFSSDFVDALCWRMKALGAPKVRNMQLVSLNYKT